jgi:hypothetical protein
MNGSPAPALSVHADFIKSQLPAWLTRAPDTVRKALRESLIKSNQARHDLKAFLHQLKSPEAFARPLLRRALRRQFPTPYIDDTAILSREWKHHHLLGLIKTHAKTTEHSVLEAALQNFDAAEAKDGGMETGTQLYMPSRRGRTPSAVSPSQFAELCRRLDLGERYQSHLDAVLGPTYSLRMSSRAHRYFMEQAKHAFAVALHLAYLQGNLPHSVYTPLLALAEDGHHADLTCSHLTLDGVLLPSVLVIRHSANDKEVLLYTPNDPQAPLRRHVSVQELDSKLAERLSQSPHYMTFFKGLVPLRYRETLLKIKPAWADWYSVGATGKIVPISLENAVTCTEILGPMFLAITRQRIEQIKQDARAVAVPTADADVAARQKRLQEYADLGQSALFFAASFVPIVGQVLLVVSAAQLVNTVYNGFAAWSRGDSDEALNDLLDVVDNIALAVATAGAVKTVGFTAGLVKVKLRQGGERLWKSDLAPYRCVDKALPGALRADAQGLYTHEQRAYVKLDDHVHAVQRNAQTGEWALQHPSDPDAYAPPLVSNGVGAWRQVHESARDWDDLKLIKRLGPDAANITEPQVASLLLLSGLDSKALRQVHQETLRPPPLLRDTLQRFNLDQEIRAFDFERAEGSTVTPCSPFIQLHLLGSLPQWPEGRVLKVIDEHGATRFSHGTGATELKVPLARFERGDLLHYVKQHLPTHEFNELLPKPGADDLGNVENLAQRLTEEARQHPQRVFAWLQQTLGKPPASTVEQELARLVPELPTSHREEMAVVLGPEQQRRLQLEKSLTAQQHWEADQYLQQLRASRVRESLYLDASGHPEAPAMLLATLGELPGWPAAQRIEVREQTVSGTLLCSLGADDAPSLHVVIREAERYRLRDNQSLTLQAPTDLLSAITPTLSNAELMAVLRQSEVRTLKQAVHKAALKAMARQPLPTRAKLPRSASFPTSHQVDPLFADPTAPIGLAADTNGIYQAPALPDGSVRHYVLSNGRFYRVRRDHEGWRLMDARSPFRAYQPYIAKRSGGGWQLEDITESPSVSPEPPGAHSSTSEEFVSAESASEYESADEGSTVYTPNELRRMRSSDSYQESHNYRRVYDRANNGRYPLRDLNGQPMRIRFIQSEGRSARRGETFSKNLIMPFIQWEGFEKVAALYDDKLKVVHFTAAHQRFAEESSLIGQFTVVTTRAIKKGEALGVYGGELVPLHIAEIRNDPYLLDIFVHRHAHSSQGGAAHSRQISPDVALSGDNVLSRINTLFEYENGKPARQARSGYNVVNASFMVDTQVGEQPMTRLLLTGFFASEDLAAGTELRWNYGYSDALIERMFEELPPDE